MLGKTLLQLFYREIDAYFALQEILVVFFSTGKIGQASRVFSGSAQLLQAFYQFLIGGKDFFLENLAVCLVQLFLVFFGKLSVVF